MIRAIVFDFDGVILDTETPYYQSWLEVFLEYGIDLSPSHWAASLGGEYDPARPLAVLETQIGRSIDHTRVLPRRERRELEILATMDLMPGVSEYIREARRLGMLVGIASSSGREWVMGHLERLDLLGFFDSVVTADEVRNTKPDPEVYHSVLSSLGVAAGNALAIEDSPKGVRAAREAGLFCVGVPNQITRHLPALDADLDVPSLAEIPLRRLLEIASGRRG